jgi:hypothetical protein
LNAGSIVTVAIHATSLERQRTYEQKWSMLYFLIGHEKFRVSAATASQPTSHKLFSLLKVDLVRVVELLLLYLLYP